jgi:alkylated DNA repair protein (DNA oxidative demethylase)
MPAALLHLAVRAASEAGFNNNNPNACLINRYVADAGRIILRASFASSPSSPGVQHFPA